jgi:hypothetical protein
MGKWSWLIHKNLEASSDDLYESTISTLACTDKEKQ